MAIASGTATDYLDLLSKLRTFLTTDATLTGLGQNWTELHTTSSPYTDSHGDTVEYETFLQAPGLSGTEEIFLNIQAYKNVVSDYYNWRMAGAVGYNSSSNFNNQPGQSPFEFIYLWNQSISYWFVANGQRVIIVAKVSSVYESAYLGKFLAYGTPGQYPYPVAVGGCGAFYNKRFSLATDDHRAFFHPGSMNVYYIDGTWQDFINKTISGGITTQRNVWPFLYEPGPQTVLTWAASDQDGGYPLLPAMLNMSVPANNLLGELDGVFFVPGYSQSSESTITIGGDTYQVFQNVFRTSAEDYMAIKQA